MVAAIISAVIAFSVHWATFVDVYVVDVGARGILTIRADGEERTIAKLKGTHDVAYAKFTLRRARGRMHEVVITDKTGGEQTFALDDATDGKSGWVIAPAARANDMCFVDAETIYGSPIFRRTAEAELLQEQGAATFPVKHTFDLVFEAPPATITTEERSVRKRTLRAYVCSALSEDRVVPYRDRGVSGRQPSP
jgi:hypothetical protein